MSYYEVFDTLKTLLANYLEVAWLFCVLHVGVIVIYTLHIQRILQESNSLDHWIAGDEPKNDCARVLQQFVNESRHWGPKGVFVPMTDFSDRLDSFVGGRLDALHNHNNLFLVIGVAGTFFAMFRFALSALNAGTTPNDLSQSLAKGLAHAFPVGFVGLILSVIGHFVAGWVEDRYRKAVNDATQGAMRVRQETGVSVFDRLETSLAPLQNLEKVLAGSLQPVIDGFQQQLVATSELLQQQIQPLAIAVAAIGPSIAVLAVPARNLAEAATGLPGALAETARLQQENRQLLEGTTAIVRESAASFDAAAKSMLDASGGIRDLPESLRTTFQIQLQQMTKESERLWNDSARELFAALAPACGMVTESAQALQNSSNSLGAIPENVGQKLQAALSELSSLHSRQLRDLSNQSFDAWANACGQFINRMNEATNALCTSVGEESSQAARALAEAGREIQNITNGVSLHLDSTVEQLYSRSLEQLRPHLQRIDEAISVKYPSALATLTETCTHLKELDRVSRQIAPEMERIQTTLRSAADDLSRVRVARDVPATSPEELTAIRKGIERLADHLAASSQLGLLDRLFGQKPTKTRPRP